MIPEEKYEWVKQLNNEGCGISSISRLLEISKSSVQRLIERIASVLKLHEISSRFKLQAPNLELLKWKWNSVTYGYIRVLSK